MGNSKLKKIIMTVTAVAVVGLTSTIFGNPAQAETLNNLQNKQTQIENEREEVKAKLSKADAEIADILFDLKEINEDIAKVNEALKENQAMLKEAKNDVTKTEEEIALLEEEIAELEERIEARFDILKERATSYQKTGGSIGFLEVLFGSKNFGDLISRASAVSKITNSDADLIKEQEEDKAEVEKKQVEVEEKLAEQIELKTELEGMETLIQNQQEDNKQGKKVLEKKEKELVVLKADLENQDSSLADLEAEIRKDIAAVTAPPVVNSSSSSDSEGNLTTVATVTSNDSNANSNGSGVLGWPTVGGYISSYMGPRWGRQHNGIDIARTDRSTSPPIYAADGGVVESAKYDGAYGNKIVINHNNGMKTVYAHLSSMSVSAGQNVSKGSTIGVMGTTGSSTGIHLHLEVYENGSLKDPMNFLK